MPNSNYPFFWDPINYIREALNLGHFNPKNTILGGVWAYDHKRLYYVDSIKRLAEKAGFKVKRVETLTHYCFPFNYLILRLGKLFYMSLPSSAKLRGTMEKFDWNKEEPNNKFSLTGLIFKFFRRMDYKNDKYPAKITDSALTISLKLEK